MSIEVFTINAIEYTGYVDLAEADAYYSLNVDHAWNSLADDVQKVLIINATRRIDLLRYKSTRTVKTQETKFPRKEYGLPEDVELACILLASIINEDPTQQFVVDSNANVSRVKAGPVDIEFYKTIDVELKNAENSIVDPTIRALLAPYLATGLPADNVASSVGAAYGTGARSFFEDRRRYHRYDTNY